MTARWLIAGWLAALVLFLGAPSVDLDFSRLFWRAGEGFTVIDRPLWEWVRQWLWTIELLIVFAALVLGIRAFALGRAVLGLGVRAWGFIVALFALAPGAVVNGYFKMHSGRARPSQIEEFGGSRLFSPAWDFADQCQKNCSFVSGEVSAAVALGVTLWLVSSIWPLEAWVRVYLRVAGVVITVFMVLQRVSSGRHFISDAVFGVLITLTIAWCLYAVLSGGWRDVLQGIRAMGTGRGTGRRG